MNPKYVLTQYNGATKLRWASRGVSVLILNIDYPTTQKQSTNDKNLYQIMLLFLIELDFPTISIL